MIRIIAKISGEEDKSVEAGEEAAHPYHFLVSGPRNLSSPNWRDLIHSGWCALFYFLTGLSHLSLVVSDSYNLELDLQEGFELQEDGGSLLHIGSVPVGIGPTRDENKGECPRSVLVEAIQVQASPDSGRRTRWFYLRRDSGVGSSRRHGRPHTDAAAGRSQGRYRDQRDAAEEPHHQKGLAGRPPLPRLGELEGLREVRRSSASSAIGGRPLRQRQCVHRRALVGRGLRSPDKAKASEADAESERRAAEAKRWVPNFYVNNSDYICCYYSVAVSAPGSVDTSKDCEGNAVATLFVASKGLRKFLEAHGLQQWWSDDTELDSAVNRSKLMDQQLRSLYTSEPLMPH
ncbi:GDSL esterase/lipase [Canna indica]|uniref:GDSL esterase/lipase n=1 Tax=Canna indica TaxID=4628 RepID=A0AAQ3K7M9_9LILI|nr:GDSL esterase/lipase [Canna indica]